MARETVGQALNAMRDAEVRKRISGGDFSDIENLSFSDEEKELVQRAAAEYPEGSDLDLHGLDLQASTPPDTGDGPIFNGAVQYAMGGIDSADVIGLFC